MQHCSGRGLKIAVAAGFAGLAVGLAVVHTEDSPGLRWSSIVSLSVGVEMGGYSKRTNVLVVALVVAAAAVVLVLLVVLIESLACAVLRIESLGLSLGLLIILLLVLPVCSSTKGLARLERGSARLE